MRENHIRIPRDIEKIEVAVNQSLCAHDPETHRREAEHDRVMDRHAEAERDKINQNELALGTIPRRESETTTTTPPEQAR